jgi:hypothetical protein
MRSLTGALTLVISRDRIVHECHKRGTSVYGAYPRFPFIARMRIWLNALSVRARSLRDLTDRAPPRRDSKAGEDRSQQFDLPVTMRRNA